jgi:hypothetical protein
MYFVGLSPSFMSITYGVFKLVILRRNSWESKDFLPSIKINIQIITKISLSLIQETVS